MNSIDPYYKKTVPYTFEGNTFAFKVSQDLFSSLEVDHGTQRLLRTFLFEKIDSFTKVLDLGCGYGPIGIVLKKICASAEVHMIDRDALAVEYAKANAQLNGVSENTFCYGSLGYDNVKDTDFDLIVSNIPAKCCINEEIISVQASSTWSDDPWYLDQEKRNFITNEGYWVFNEGNATGTIWGGNLSTFSLLQGTEYFPDLEQSILFIEDDAEALPHHFDRLLQSLIHQSSFTGVKGIVFGRFQKESRMIQELLSEIIKNKSELQQIPIIGNVDFGHTTPTITFPIGGTAKLSITKQQSEIIIETH